MITTKNIKSILACTLIFLGFSALIFIENPVLEKIETNLSVWRTNYAPEKVYVHHDKPYYMTGEVIWLSAYLVHASDLTPSDKSKILYVDLINDKNELVKKLKLETDQGRTNGDLSIPGDLQEGEYTLVAYTNWMRNFGEEQFFKKSIYIWSPESKNKDPEAPVNSHPDFQVFPEGGEMVNGINGRVAFKATGSDGRGIKVNGGIYDDTGLKVTDIVSTHGGMGDFDITPDPSRSYFAKVTFENGYSQEYPLPDVSTVGFGMGFETKRELIEINTFTNQPGGENVLLTGIAGDQLLYSKEFHLIPNEKYLSEIPKSAFPTGIVRFTLAKSTGEPLAERLVFVDHADQLNLTIKSNQQQFLSREQVMLEIEARDQQGNPVSTSFSLAVTDDQLASKEREGLQIQSYLLLTSDLKGYIESPGYYFNPENKDRHAALDLLMMTQGWRRFAWKDLLEDNFPAIDHSPQFDISIRGSLQKDNGDPIQDGEAILFLKDKYQTFITTETNENGDFVFEGFHFKDSIDVLIQGTDARGRTGNVNVSIDDEVYFPQLQETENLYTKSGAGAINRDYFSPSLPLFQGIETDINSLELGELLLEEVIVEGRAEISRPFTLHRNADVVIEANQLPTAPSGNILEVLQGRVAGLQVFRSGPNQFSAVIRGQGTPLYLLDGVPVDESMLQSINQYDISRIEILKSPGNVGIYGGRGSGGVIALFTQRGPTEMEDPETGDHIIIQRVGGFSKTRQFYSPKYGENTRSETPDFRSTIYWNPNVVTNENGIAKVNFFTADRSTLYRVIAEGISEKGKVGQAELMLEVY
ncbi:TonB-dependent receptor plug domain-containing protein [Cyclobacterium jeungdonense]|uniref:TonB-dependent receptor plug domain-containing protein n=1 Tax=Cyclobacterium jeungdonense TaxID=708087 RepID=A0ABT8CDE9_9BACT|nr:TonB-dependent receptor plug domain-containing protein [Cyclobacterium jeungdonense]MDN3689808.1 TonB-dependent receptor plug domain-containing protein [Cyclobacterium jeungdonense]